jgi:carbon storage regulator
VLILTRRPSESVRIGDDVTITVLGIKNGQVRIGVSAPKTIPVHREEVYERIRAASGATTSREVPAIPV